MKHHILLTLLTLLLLSSCSLIEDKLPPCGTDTGDTVTLSFQMLTVPSYPGSRADANDHKEVESEYSTFEDRIDVSDLSLFVFAKVAGNADDSEVLVLNTSDFPGEPAVVVEDLGVYTVTLKILREKLYDALGIVADPNSNVNLSFRMMMLANCGSNSVDWSKISGTDFTTVVNQINQVWSVAMSSVYNGSDTDSDPTVEELYGKTAAMPMFGTLSFVISQEALYYSRPDKRIYMGEMEMLRALAKIRVIDNIEKDTSGYPYIVSSSFIGTQEKALPLPANAVSYKNGNQVHDTNVADPARELATPNEVTYRLGLLSNDLAKPSDKWNGAVRIGYVPEQSIGTANNNVAVALPIFRIAVAYADDFIKEYNIAMTSYNGINFTFGNAIFRNHIYTLTVDQAELSTLSLTVDLVPYIGVTLEPEFGVD